jgi:hypothetical protein
MRSKYSHRVLKAPQSLDQKSSQGWETERAAFNLCPVGVRRSGKGEEEGRVKSQELRRVDRSFTRLPPRRSSSARQLPNRAVVVAYDITKGDLRGRQVLNEAIRSDQRVDQVLQAEASSTTRRISTLSSAKLGVSKVSISLRDEAFLKEGDNGPKDNRNRDQARGRATDQPWADEIARDVAPDLSHEAEATRSDASACTATQRRPPRRSRPCTRQQKQQKSSAEAIRDDSRPKGAMRSHGADVKVDDHPYKRAASRTKERSHLKFKFKSTPPRLNSTTHPCRASTLRGANWKQIGCVSAPLEVWSSLRDEALVERGMVLWIFPTSDRLRKRARASAASAAWRGSTPPRTRAIFLLHSNITSISHLKLPSRLWQGRSLTVALSRSI